MKKLSMFFYLFMISCILITINTLAFEVEEIRFTNSYCNGKDGKRPDSVTSFTDIDLGVTVWIFYKDYEKGKEWKLELYSPNSFDKPAYTASNTLDRNIAQGYSYRSVPREILWQSKESGKWTVKFYYDGNLCGTKSTYSFDYKFTMKDPQNDIFKANKIYAIPSYLQTYSAYGGFEGDGSNYCAPTSISNSLMWLANNGYDNLAWSTKDRKKDQYDMIKDLAKNMGTDPDEGTNVNKVITGLRKYIADDCGYKNITIQYQGWRECPDYAKTGMATPNMDWIKGSISKGVWLNIGWYKYTPNDEYNRFGGHWVTLVGFDDKGRMIIHDPATGYFNHYVKPEKIKSGKLTGNFKGLEGVKASDFYYLEEGMRLNSNADYGIIDGVVTLEMDK